MIRTWNVGMSRLCYLSSVRLDRADYRCIVLIDLLRSWVTSPNGLPCMHALDQNTHEDLAVKDECSRLLCTLEQVEES